MLFVYYRVKYRQSVVATKGVHVSFECNDSASGTMLVHRPYHLPLVGVGTVSLGCVQRGFTVIATAHIYVIVERCCSNGAVKTQRTILLQSHFFVIKQCPVINDLPNPTSVYSA